MLDKNFKIVKQPFSVDSAPWLTGVLKELGLRYGVESLRNIGA